MKTWNLVYLADTGDHRYLKSVDNGSGEVIKCDDLFPPHKLFLSFRGAIVR